MCLPAASVHQSIRGLWFREEIKLKLLAYTPCAEMPRVLVIYPLAGSAGSGSAGSAGSRFSMPFRFVWFRFPLIGSVSVLLVKVIGR